MNIKLRSHKNYLISWLRGTALRKASSFIRRKLNVKKDPWSDNKNAKIDSKVGSSVEILFNRKFNNKICLLAVRESKLEYFFKRAARDLKLDLVIVDPLSDFWYQNAKNSRCDGFLFAIQHTSRIYREAFKERMELFYKKELAVWPTWTESYIYEAKRSLAGFLNAKKIPHPKTSIFFKKEEALDFVKNYSSPLIMKTDMGASASGVALLRNNKEKIQAVDLMFKNGFVSDERSHHEKDWGYIIFQEFLPNIREFRIIKIGDYWFGHEKIVNQGYFHSGSGLNSWEVPSERVFNFCRNIAVSHDIHVAAFDVFQTESGNLLINEIQTWFGSYNPSQMYFNSKPGAFVYNGKWEFLEGYFNINRSANLRLVEFDKYITKKKQKYKLQLQ